MNNISSKTIQVTTLLSIMLFGFMSCQDNPNDSGSVDQIEVSLQALNILEENVDQSVFVQMQLSEESDELITVYVSSGNGTADESEDYFPFENIPIVFEPGTKYKEFKITILGDEDYEEDEYFDIRITNIEGFAFPGTGVIQVVIENDDPSPFELIIPENGYETPESYPGMSLFWSDEFDSTAVNEGDWTFELGHGSGGWGNNELQFYKKENASIVDGNLVIEARRETTGSQYSSTRIITKDKVDFKYGRVDIRAVLPYGQGVWPALWMLGANINSVSWPACGEIDIMELIGHQPDRVFGTAHWRANGQHASHGGNKQLNSGIYNDEFHVFSIIWDEDQIRWFLDDVQFHSLSITSGQLDAFHKNQFFIFNVAVGGNWPGNPDNTTVFPQRMIVDYIRVFQ